ncbi:MAG TPA: VOC family protein [Chloroflexota bacterium]|nr:VOC family protein [Chloroflexota bacterium]
MTVYIGSTVLNTTNMEGGIAFWTAALGYVVRNADPTFAVLTDPHRRWSNLSLQHTEEPKTGRNRLHLDLYSDDRDAEVARLESLGARRLPWDYPDDADFVVLADPDGNEFCVIQSAFTQDS